MFNSNEKPTQPGWYWYGNSKIKTIAEVEISLYLGGGLTASFIEHDHPISLVHLDEYWFGPLEIPEGPE